ncbi:MAG: YgiQ family radical SAM protein, partial [Kiritimatiellae bacterium]|nr:YgiQ family radical SAM protein [Kiritimatiellia bacterium]
ALDIVIISGDAYIDHPAFGAALIGRWLTAHGFRVGVIAQPRWDSAEDVMQLGRPRLFFGITAGALDSMLAHYTAFRKKRADDAYSPGGRAGLRPNRATIVYTGWVRHGFPDVPIVIGGVEASMRRATHYDFWNDSLRRSILLESKADLLIYGMAEKAVLEVAERLASHVRTTGKPISARSCRELLHGIRGTCFALSKDEGPPPHSLRMPSHEEISTEPSLLLKATRLLEQQVMDESLWLTQSADNRCVVFAPPFSPLSTDEMDALYDLPFSRRPHPSYSQPIPAARMMAFSITTHRGCGGGCTFCCLPQHQGRRIQSRSRRSILDEVRRLTAHPDWQGTISDVGAPTANMWGARCLAVDGPCRRASCLWPETCQNFRPNQSRLAELLHEITKIPGVKHVRTASGIRHDLALADAHYLHVLVSEFVGGHLKVAPEHCAERVLHLMRKPPFDRFLEFLSAFDRISKDCRKEQYVVPYLMSAFPGCTDLDMEELAQWFRRRHWKPLQVQCFVPTPGTLATAMYFAGVDADGRPIPVPRTDAERLRQHRILIGVWGRKPK